MTEDELTQIREILRAELAPIRDELASLRRAIDAMGPQVAGAPPVHRALETLQQEIGQIKDAVNDLAAIQTTSGEIEALHIDVNKTMTREDELEGRIAWLEQQVRKLREAK